MDRNGQDVLRLSGRVVAAEDLRTSLNGQRRLIVPTRTVITPLALEQLRARGVAVEREEPVQQPASTARWGFAQEQPSPLVPSVMQSLAREDLALRELPSSPGRSCGAWARKIGDCVARGDCQGGIVFCQEPGLVCCIANKIAGLRAAVVTTPTQARRVMLVLGPNLVALEADSRTFFELKQMLRTIVSAEPRNCPPDVSCVLTELDGHAHR